MPRIPDAEVERIKREVSIERLAEARGIKLERHGKDLRGLCPFHEDHEPSLVIDTDQNLWHCFGACSAGGSVIDWVMKANAVGFRHAVELLRAGAPALLAAPQLARPPKRTTTRLLPPAVSLEASQLELLAQVSGFYLKKLPDSPQALEYLVKRELVTPGIILEFHLGFCDRTLCLTIPEKNRQAGATLRERLGELGIINPRTGHELFRGCLTVPLTDDDGHVVSLYGRRIADNPRPGAVRHLYLPGPHRGLLNFAAIKSCDELILCESPLDALTFWAAGYKNVTCSYGVNGFTQAHRDAFARYRTGRILIAYDNDEAGNSAAEKLAHELMATGLECFRIRFPHGMDANEYAVKVTPPAKSLGLLIRSATWMGKGPAPTRPPLAAPGAPVDQASASPVPEPATALSFAASSPTPPSPATPAAAPPPAIAETLVPASPAARQEAPPVAAEAKEDPEVSPECSTPVDAAGVAHGDTPAASPVPAPPAPPQLSQVAENEATLERAGRRYRVRGLSQTNRFDALRVNLLAQSEHGFHVDTLDLFQAKARIAFEKTAALELGCAEQLIHADLAALLVAIEQLPDARCQKPPPIQSPAAAMSEQDRSEALALLRDPDLVGRILEHFELCGIVGEETNKLTGHLAGLSRKFEKPLAVIIQSGSSAGKTTLMDGICDFIPLEDRQQYSAMTGQALFYMGETDLAHKVLAIVEEEGAERASYALKLLQSEGQLKIASTGKDPTSGKLVTHDYQVQGPVMIFLTTTSSDLDDELANRCLLLTVDEDRDQTRAIHQRQRLRRSLAGLLASNSRADLHKLHQNAQRLLKPIPVVNPFVERLTFMDDKTRTRRDHEKYLTLIDTIALLHQHQRPLKSAPHRGSFFRYIEVTLDDLRLANRLADEVLGHSLDELPPQTRRLLSLLDAMVTQACQHLDCPRSAYLFSRRQVREYTGWGNTQLKVHLARLEDFEYLVAHRSGPGLSFAYELTYDGRGTDGKPFLTGLIDVDGLAAQPGEPAGTGHEYGRNRSGQNTHRSALEGTRSALPANRSGAGRPLVGPRSGPGRTPENAETPCQIKPTRDSTPPSPETIDPRCPAQPAPGRTRSTARSRAARARPPAAPSQPGKPGPSDGNGGSNPCQPADESEEA